jgi:hypothetical protein
MKANQNFSRKLDPCPKSDPTHLSSNSAKTELENTITVETQLDVSKVISEIMTIKSDKQKFHHLTDISPNILRARSKVTMITHQEVRKLRVFDPAAQYHDKNSWNRKLKHRQDLSLARSLKQIEKRISGHGQASLAGAERISTVLTENSSAETEVQLKSRTKMWARDPVETTQAGRTKQARETKIQSSAATEIQARKLNDKLGERKIGDGAWA